MPSTVASLSLQSDEYLGQEMRMPENIYEFIQHITRPHPLAKIPFYTEYSVTAWVIFTLGLLVFMILDLGVFHRMNQSMSFGTAAFAMAFWVSVGLLFNLFIFVQRGFPSAMIWFNGFVLEWALSLDNLFIFYLVFSQYRTPEEQKYKALFYGVMGAILLRLLFFTVGEFLFEYLSWLKIVFGFFLIYTGIKTVVTNDDDEDFEAADNIFVKAVSTMMPVIPRYGPNAEFFVRDSRTDRSSDYKQKKRDGEREAGGPLSNRSETAAETAGVHAHTVGVHGSAAIPQPRKGHGRASATTATYRGDLPSGGERDREFSEAEEERRLLGGRGEGAGGGGRIEVVAGGAAASASGGRSSLPPKDNTQHSIGGMSATSSVMMHPLPTGSGPWKATLLFLVVVALEGIDLVFAIDSTSAKLAAIPDIFLAYTSTVLAMLGLRACFFVVDEIVRFFELMKYGLCVILVFIGLKLMFSWVIHISNVVTCVVLLGVLSVTIVASIAHEFWKRRQSAQGYGGAGVVSNGEGQQAGGEPETPSGWGQPHEKFRDPELREDFDHSRGPTGETGERDPTGGRQGDGPGDGPRAVSSGPAGSLQMMQGGVTGGQVQMQGAGPPQSGARTGGQGSGRMVVHHAARVGESGGDKKTGAPSTDISRDVSV
uniref:Uncharacterized protein n=1 Tax=Chromera velia CCMP2878 TaxID=1169474 RepID=A0A0G4HEU3_9ALVE|eukprot:Cvel_26704.t1-p1 / transcript=Cvel_26704.t1 / gene=Cvel_26704 / organism=Chromera_velia_CCMP2878 / gene_product=Uncharacterized membrane protein RBE_0082, putative / transcript_product=Uncharacterized membrane protein RBE_0082, putative / location=Cvel_scaffold3218:2578-10317(+) / protein_length=652 / sequence_SO=supercontig / SO=protein_coding / is_pseudo=false